MRKTIRYDEKKEAIIKDMINEDDTSKIMDFAMDWTIQHIKFVTESLIGPEWDVIFQRKRKTMELKRRVYE